MKNFPHQINNLDKLTAALATANVVLGAGQDLASDEIFGEALARAGIYTFRNKNISVDENLRNEKQKALGDQGFRTAARDIRRLFRLAGFLYPDSTFTERGQDLVASAGNIQLRNALWRDAMLQLSLEDTNGNVSHPYRIMMRLVADRPGIETSKLLLALEARDDGPAEYTRVSNLANLGFPEIIQTIGIEEANARNATKILPGIAEQIGDIARNGNYTYLAQRQIATEDSLIEPVQDEYERTVSSTPTPVDPADISALPDFGEAVATNVDLSAAIEMRKRRTIEHHKTVVSIAKVLGGNGYTTYERPYDCLGHKETKGSLLIEVKTLDGTRSDERRQCEKALGQLRGYRFFNVPESLRIPKIAEIVAYSTQPSSVAIDFMRNNAIHSAWRDNDHWLAADLTGNISNLSPDELLA